MVVEFNKETLKKQIKDLPVFHYPHGNDGCFYCKKNKKLRQAVVRGVMEIMEGFEVKNGKS